MTGCIAVIDDESDLLEMVCEILEMEGFEAICLGQPQEVPAVMENQEPDLFLVDIMLPGTSGIELAEQLRKDRFPATPMIAMSASKIMRQVAADSGLFQDTIDKPFDVEELIDCVARYTKQAV